MTPASTFRLTVAAIGVVFLMGDPGYAMLPSSPPDARPAPADYDGDGSTDIAVKGSNGIWYIDLHANGFGGRWDLAYTGYGGVVSHPVPADYDGDGAEDVGAKGDVGTGSWGVDYASNTFGVWDVLVNGYGNASTTAVPADYDGDGRADLSVKSTAGEWFIDYASDGFGAWNASFGGYGNAAAVPVPGDYDGDHRADLAVKYSDGCWYIDYRSNGFTGWDAIHCGYGTTSIQCPADYDNDGRFDLSVKGGDGTWFVDYAVDGFGAWNAIYSGYGGDLAIAVPGDYDGDGLLDLSVCSIVDGTWYIDYAANGYAGWDYWITNPDRVLVDTTRPYITSTTIYGEGNEVVSELTVGVRYTVDVVVHRGSGPDNAAGVEINDALGVPASLKLVNRRGSTYVENVGVDSYGSPVDETHRRYALTCTQEGNFPLGFQLRSKPPYYAGSEVFNPDYGIRVIAVRPAQFGISGRVTQRVQDGAGVFIQGPPIQNATVTLVSAGGLTTTTDVNGKWHFPVAGGPMTVKITKSGYSDLYAVNLSVPVTGFLVEAEMERSFPDVPSGIQYKTYLDYSRGRTRLHVVEVDPAAAHVRIGKAPFDPTGPCPVSCSESQCPTFATLHSVGESLGAHVIMNATWWNICNGNPLGYVYSQGEFLGSEVWCDNRGGPNDCTGSDVYYVEGSGTTPLYPAGSTPMLTIMGYHAGQGFGIVESHSNFLETPSTQWNQVGNPPHPIWDVARDGVSDITSALQIGNPPLLRNGAVVAGGDFVYDLFGNYDYAFARTSVGVGANGWLYLVIADGAATARPAISSGVSIAMCSVPPRRWDWTAACPRRCW